jgi:hypothetical protein
MGSAVNASSVQLADVLCKRCERSGITKGVTTEGGDGC